MGLLDDAVRQSLRLSRQRLEEHFDADVLAYYGEIATEWLPWFRGNLERLGEIGRKERLLIVLNTPGGQVEAVERMVEMIRRWYQEVYFLVPNLAMSAGTIFCMSGEKIFMDYSSALGPIDPQVQSKDGTWVPALGYLDKFAEFVDKSSKNQLTGVEFAIAQSHDLAVLRRYEQARDLSVSLLKQWLVAYKFKTWTHHRSCSSRKGQEVTLEEKQNRAEEIARQLGDNGKWHSHGRMIGIETLRRQLRLDIEDFTDDRELRTLVNSYHDLIVDYVQRQNWRLFVDCRGVNG